MQIGQTLAPLVTAPMFAWSLTTGTSIGFPFDVWLLFLIYAICVSINAVLGSQLPNSIDFPHR